MTRTSDSGEVLARNLMRSVPSALENGGEQVICKRKGDYTNIPNLDLECFYIVLFFSAFRLWLRLSSRGWQIHFTGGKCGLVVCKVS